MAVGLPFLAEACRADHQQVVAEHLCDSLPGGGGNEAVYVAAQSQLLNEARLMCRDHGPGFVEDQQRTNIGFCRVHCGRVGVGDNVRLVPPHATADVCRQEFGDGYRIVGELGQDNVTGRVEGKDQDDRERQCRRRQHRNGYLAEERTGQPVHGPTRFVFALCGIGFSECVPHGCNSLYVRVCLSQQAVCAAKVRRR